ncbi:MAG: hypothetical protein H6735_23125 [Alphaproteobacteria bacterium]|nr:hypothetical protein [Alphaproteobacteria bacterium]
MSAELAAVRCSGCGGTVRMVAGRSLPRCLFCGADAADLVPTEPPEGIEPPVGQLPFVTTADQARETFQTFATSSIWYPDDLRSAKLELRPLLLPAWAWSGEVETHWTGLVSSTTRSGKAPVAGVDHVRFEQILVPASRSLRMSELASLGAWDERALTAFDPETCEHPMELSELTRSAARQRAQQEMEARHRSSIERDHGLRKIRVSSLVTQLEGRPVMVPVFIGAYRYGDRTFRVLVNAQSGRFVGSAPKSWIKMFAAFTLGVVVLVALVLGVMACSGLFAVAAGSG